MPDQETPVEPGNQDHGGGAPAEAKSKEGPRGWLKAAQRLVREYSGAEGRTINGMLDDFERLTNHIAKKNNVTLEPVVFERLLRTNERRALQNEAFARVYVREIPRLLDEDKIKVASTARVAKDPTQTHATKQRPLTEFIVNDETVFNPRVIESVDLKKNNEWHRILEDVKIVRRESPRTSEEQARLVLTKTLRFLGNEKKRNLLSLLVRPEDIKNFETKAAELITKSREASAKATKVIAATTPREIYRPAIQFTECHRIPFTGMGKVGKKWPLLAGDVIGFFQDRVEKNHIPNGELFREIISDVCAMGEQHKEAARASFELQKRYLGDGRFIPEKAKKHTASGKEQANSFTRVLHSLETMAGKWDFLKDDIRQLVDETIVMHLAQEEGSRIEAAHLELALAALERTVEDKPFEGLANCFNIKAAMPAKYDKNAVEHLSKTALKFARPLLEKGNLSRVFAAADTIPGRREVNKLEALCARIDETNLLEGVIEGSATAYMESVREAYIKLKEYDTEAEQILRSAEEKVQDIREEADEEKKAIYQQVADDLQNREDRVESLTEKLQRRHDRQLNAYTKEILALAGLERKKINADIDVRESKVADIEEQIRILEEEKSRLNSEISDLMQKLDDNQEEAALVIEERANSLHAQRSKRVQIFNAALQTAKAHCQTDGDAEISEIEAAAQEKITLIESGKSEKLSEIGRLSAELSKELDAADARFFRAQVETPAPTQQ